MTKYPPLPFPDNAMVNLIKNWVADYPAIQKVSICRGKKPIIYCLLFKIDPKSDEGDQNKIKEWIDFQSLSDGPLLDIKEEYDLHRIVFNISDWECWIDDGKPNELINLDQCRELYGNASASVNSCVNLITDSAQMSIHFPSLSYEALMVRAKRWAKKYYKDAPIKYIKLYNYGPAFESYWAERHKGDDQIHEFPMYAIVFEINAQDETREMSPSEENEYRKKRVRGLIPPKPWDKLLRDIHYNQTVSERKYPQLLQSDFRNVYNKPPNTVPYKEWCFEAKFNNTTLQDSVRTEEYEPVALLYSEAKSPSYGKIISKAPEPPKTLKGISTTVYIKPNPNYQHWKLLPYWSLLEASYLVCGCDPEYKKNINTMWNEKLDPALKKEIDDKYTIIERSFTAGQLKRAANTSFDKLYIDPKKFIEWSIDKGFEPPDELRLLVQKKEVGNNLEEEITFSDDNFLPDTDLMAQSESKEWQIIKAKWARRNGIIKTTDLVCILAHNESYISTLPKIWTEFQMDIKGDSCPNTSKFESRVNIWVALFNRWVSNTVLDIHPSSKRRHQFDNIWKPLELHSPSDGSNFIKLDELKSFFAQWEIPLPVRLFPEQSDDEGKTGKVTNETRPGAKPKSIKSEKAKSHYNADLSALGKHGADKRWKPHKVLIQKACQQADDQWGQNDSKRWHNEMTDWILGLNEFNELQRYRTALLKEIKIIAVKYNRVKGVKLDKK